MRKKKIELTGWKAGVVGTIYCAVIIAVICGILFACGLWVRGCVRIVKGVAGEVSKTRIARTVGKKISYWLEDPNDTKE